MRHTQTQKSAALHIFTAVFATGYLRDGDDNAALTLSSYSHPLINTISSHATQFLCLQQRV